MELEKIIKFITGNLEEAEANEVRGWIHADEANKSEFIRLKNLHALSSKGKHSLTIEKEYLLFEQQIKQKPKPTKSFTFRQYLRYAAVLAVALFVGYSVSEFKHLLPFADNSMISNEFYSPEGQISEFKLVDGTRVWLNSGTRIKVPVNYSAKNRKLSLEGEAFFEVTKDPSHPLYVHTRELSVKVMGTSFNISSYDSENLLEITLIEGLVGIKDANGNKICKLIPGEQLVYNKTNHSKFKHRIDTSPYEAWRDGRMIFKDRSLGYIAERLERWYNVEIDFAEPTISDMKFTGTILKNKPLSQVLEILTLSAPVRFDIKVNTDQKNNVVLYTLKK